MLSTWLETCCTRSEIAQPWCGPLSSVLKISKSSVPCGRSIASVKGPVPLSLLHKSSGAFVEVQGESHSWLIFSDPTAHSPSFSSGTAAQVTHDRTVA